LGGRRSVQLQLDLLLFVLGYLAVYASALTAQGRIPAGANSTGAGRLGRIQIRDSEVILGVPMLFTRTNIDQYDF
jgi:rhamnose transport system substrate-binding protein